MRYITSKREAKRIAEGCKRLGVRVTYLHCLGSAETVCRNINDNDPVLRDLTEPRAILARTQETVAIVYNDIYGDMA